MTGSIERTAIIAAVVVVGLLVFFAYVFVRMNMRLKAQARSAERRLDVLAHIAPAFTEASQQSTPLTCQRIVDQFSALVECDVVLCFVNVNGRLQLAAKSDVGYAGFLRLGHTLEEDSIVTWAQDCATAAVIGPEAASFRKDLPVLDVSQEADGPRLARPLVGSRDRVWALCIPLTQHRGHGLRPASVGAVYAERAKDAPFKSDDLRLALLIGRLASDALQRALFADSVRRESEIDPLTQLLTATAFRKRLREEVERRRFAEPGASKDVALFFIDTDVFKQWNDTFGHIAGDKLLRLLAEMFSQTAATGGFAGRNGGDEFCIALLERTKDDAIAVAQSLRARVEATDFMSAAGIVAPRVSMTISVGVAHFPVDVPPSAKAPADELLEAADARMYDAKRAGRNRVEYSLTRALPKKIRYPGEGPVPRR